MFREILSALSRFIRWLARWWADKSITSWKHEFHRLRTRDNKWVWAGLCIFFIVFLLPYLAKDAFSSSILLGLSFLWASFVAISLGYILRSPILLILVYVAVLFRQQITSIFFTAKDSALQGDIIGAVILLFLGIFLTEWAKRIGEGDL
jgi:uncharacterized membrane protein